MKKIYFEVVSDQHRQHPEEVIQLPQRASKHSVAYDVYSPVEVVLEPMKPTRIWTDVKFKFPTSLAMLLNVRSSYGKVPIIIAHGLGFIEADYYGNPENDGNLGVMLLNLSNKPYTVKKGERIGQVMFVHYFYAQMGNTDQERIGGTGSSDAYMGKEIKEEN